MIVKLIVQLISKVQHREGTHAEPTVLLESGDGVSMGRPWWHEYTGQRTREKAAQREDSRAHLVKC